MLKTYPSDTLFTTNPTRKIDVEFGVNIVTMGQVCLREFGFYPVVIR